VFREVPAPDGKHAGHDGTEERYPVVDGRIWAVLQSPVLPQQVERPEELSVMPYALLHSLAYRLDQEGVELPDSLRRAVLERDEELSPEVAPGQLSYLEVAGAAALAFRLTYGPTQALTTLFDDSWLVGARPVDAVGSLSVWTAPNE